MYIIMNRLKIMDNNGPQTFALRVQLDGCIFTENQRKTSLPKGVYLIIFLILWDQDKYHIFINFENKHTPHHRWLMTRCLVLNLKSCVGYSNKQMPPRIISQNNQASIYLQGCSFHTFSLWLMRKDSGILLLLLPLPPTNHGHYSYQAI